MTDVATIVADVRDRGDEALHDWAERLGDGPPNFVTARGEIDTDVLAAVRALIAAVEVVHAAQRPSETTVTPISGVEVSRRWLPVESVGIYVPAGLPSSLVMTAVPARLAGVWTSAEATPRRAALEKSFLSSGAPAAGEVWVRVAATLDRYAADWLRGYRDACEAAQVRREQSAAALDLRMSCLDQKRNALAALVDVFSTADREVVSRAVGAAGALPWAATGTGVSVSVNAARPASNANPPPSKGLRIIVLHAWYRAPNGCKVAHLPGHCNHTDVEAERRPSGLPAA